MDAANIMTDAMLESRKSNFIFETAAARIRHSIPPPANFNIHLWLFLGIAKIRYRFLRDPLNLSKGLSKNSTIQINLLLPSAYLYL